jgi:sugar/nucleoside kinase (ribokinase family)
MDYSVSKTNDKLRMLASLIPEQPPPTHVVLMPDFFLDHFLYYPKNLDQFFDDFSGVFNRGGGEISGYEQRLAAGGNAVNTSSALASLGARVTAIVRTSPLGFKILQELLGPKGVDLSMVHTDGELSLALNIEVERVNVMFGDPKGLDFPFKNLEPRELYTIKHADFVGVFNWLYNRSGTDLAENVFRYVKTNGVGKTVLDISDPQPRLQDLPKLIERVLAPSLVDILCVNENEAYFLACQLDESLKSPRHMGSEYAVFMAKKISENIRSRVDLHTASYSISAQGGEVIARAPSFRVEIKRVTGAGDAWTAGNMIGEAIGLPDEYRLYLANAVAALYLSQPDAKHPSLGEVKSFIQRAIS